MNQNTSASSVNSSLSSTVSLPSCPLGGRDEFTPPLVSTQLLVALLSLLGNGFVLRLVYITPSLHTPNNLFVCALAGADVLVAVNIPFYVSFYFDTPYVCDKTLCTTRFVVAVYVTVLSVLLMVGVAIDRYLSVMHSLKYHTIIRFRFVKRLILIVYSYVIVIVVAPVYWAIQWSDPLECDIVFIFKFWYTCYVVLFHVTISLIVTVCIYFAIFKEAWKLLKQECQCLMTPREAQLHAEAKTAKTMALILGMHMLSLMPYLVIIVWRYLDERGQNANTLSDVKKFICVLYFGKSAVNPLIYGWKNKDLRKAMLRWIGGSGDNRNSNNNYYDSSMGGVLDCSQGANRFNIVHSCVVVVDNMLHTTAKVVNVKLSTSEENDRRHSHQHYQNSGPKNEINRGEKQEGEEVSFPLPDLSSNSSRPLLCRCQSKKVPSGGATVKNSSSTNGDGRGMFRVKTEMCVRV